MSEEALPNKNEASLIDRLIQEELDESVGLGGAAKKARAAAPVQPAPPVFEGELEDPASWFSEEVETHRIPSPRPPEPRKPNVPNAGWHETGVDRVASLAEDDEDDTNNMALPSSSTPVTVESSAPHAPPLAGGLSPTPSTGAPGDAVAKRPASAGKYVLMAMAVLVVLAVAIALLGRSF
jgi:hypothetical protein